MKPNEYYKCFFISGFTYYKGPFILNKLKVGKKLKLKAEPENRYDENAVAIYYKKHKIGFVPKENNYSISKLLKNGHEVFKILVQQLDKTAHPEQQVRAVVFIKQGEESSTKLEKEPLEIIYD